MLAFDCMSKTLNLSFFIKIVVISLGLVRFLLSCLIVLTLVNIWQLLRLSKYLFILDLAWLNFFKRLGNN